MRGAVKSASWTSFQIVSRFISATEAGGPDSLAYVDPNTSHAIIKVDNTTGIPYPEKRKSVRITSKDAFGLGSVFVADIHHAPFGCSVWPSFWTWAASEAWPNGGEIDIWEGINRASQSQLGLHTLPGCSQGEDAEQSTTDVRTTDCAGENNSGCIVANTDAASYGDAFNAAGGGVLVTEFAEDAISIWFFSRADVPESITPDMKSIETSALGVPMGHWPASGCDIPQFFKPQNLMFTITLCGDFARPPEIFAATGCTGVCYADWVHEASNYHEAYFDVASVRVFSNDTSSNPTSSGSPSKSATGGGASQSAEAEGGSRATLSLGVFFWSAIVAATIAVMV